MRRRGSGPERNATRARHTRRLARSLALALAIVLDYCRRRPPYRRRPCRHCLQANGSLAHFARPAAAAAPTSAHYAVRYSELFLRWPDFNLSDVAGENLPPLTVAEYAGV
eukprot:1872868-Prymnesium_polylepis.1